MVIKNLYRSRVCRLDSLLVCEEPETKLQQSRRLYDLEAKRPLDQTHIRLHCRNHNLSFIL